MKILVAYKRVVDYNVRVMVAPDHNGLLLEGIKRSSNPFDDTALEQAIRLREAGIAKSVLVVTVDTRDSEKWLRSQALAMGADRAIHVVIQETPQPLTVARVLHKIVEKEQPDIVLMGKQSTDDDAAQVGPMLATLWGRPQATYASHISFDGRYARIVREIDGGQETVQIQLPGVITADLRLNAPRFIKLPEMMKAKNKPVSHCTLDELGLQNNDTQRIIRYDAPKQQRSGQRVEDVQALISELQQRGVLS